MKQVMLFIMLLTSIVFAQEKTVEKRSTKDSTGKVTVTESTVISHTEDITPRNYMIVINPLKFLLFYNLTFYARMSENVALGIGAQTPTISGLDGFGLNAEMRIYPKSRSLRGFYIAPNVSLNSLTSGGTTASITSLGVLLGWQWFPGEDFAMGLGIGIDHYTGSGDSGFSKVDGNAPALRFDIGFAW